MLPARCRLGVDPAPAHPSQAQPFSARISTPFAGPRRLGRRQVGRSRRGKIRVALPLPRRPVAQAREATAAFNAWIDEAGDEGFGKPRGPAQSGGQSSARGLSREAASASPPRNRFDAHRGIGVGSRVRRSP